MKPGTLRRTILLFLLLCAVCLFYSRYPRFRPPPPSTWLSPLANVPPRAPPINQKPGPFTLYDLDLKETVVAGPQSIPRPTLFVMVFWSIT